MLTLGEKRGLNSSTCHTLETAWCSRVHCTYGHFTRVPFYLYIALVNCVLSAHARAFVRSLCVFVQALLIYGLLSVEGFWFRMPAVVFDNTHESIKTAVEIGR